MPTTTSTPITARKGRQGYSSSNAVNPSLKTSSGSAGIPLRVNNALGYFLNPSTFNSQYNCDVIDYVLSIRQEKGLDTVPLQTSSIISCKSSKDDSQFIYCLRLDQIKQQHFNFDPYTLVMVSPTKVKTYKVFYTASAFSITEFHNDKICDVTDYCRWIWEKKVFQRICRISFFRRFRVAKLFCHWKNHVNHLKHEKSKACLTGSLFVTDVYLHKALMYVHSMCDNCAVGGSSEIVLLHVDNTVTYDLDEFLSMHNQQCLKASQRIVSMRESLSAVILEACQNVCSTAEIGGLLNKPDDGGLENKPPPHSKVLQWRSTLHCLAKFTKQCDQIVLNMLQHLVTSSLKDLLCCFEASSVSNDALYHKQLEDLFSMREQIGLKPNTSTVLSRYGPYEDDNVPISDLGKTCFDEPVKAKQPYKAFPNSHCHIPDKTASLWNAKLERVWENGEPAIKITPSLDDFCLAVDKVVSGVYNSVSKFTSLTCHDELLPYITQTKYDLYVDGTDLVSHWPNIEGMKCRNIHYESKIQLLIRQTFEKSQELIQEYHCYAKMIAVCNLMPVPAEGDRECWPVNKFQHVLAHFSDQVFAMEQMLLSLAVGMLDISALEFRDNCLTYPMKLLQKIEVFLPSFAAFKCNEILLYSKKTIKKLQETVTEMDSFFLHLNFIDEVKTNLVLLQIDVTYVSKLFTTAQEFEIAVTDHEFALFKSLFPQINQLKSALLFAEAAKTENISTFNLELCKQISAVHHKVLDFYKKCEAFDLLNDNQYNFFEASVPMVLIKELLDEVINLKAVVDKLCEYQLKFGAVAGQRRLYCAVSLTVSAVEVAEQLDGIRNNLCLYHKLWSLIDEWRNVKEIWINVPIASLKLGELYQRIQALQEDTFSVESALPINNFTSKLSEEMRDFQQKLKVVELVICSPVKARHWEAILCSPANKTIKTTRLTIQTLTNLKVFNNAVCVENICHQAQNEIALELLIKKVSNFWINYRLELVPAKSLLDKDTSILGNVEVIKSELNNSLNSLSSINGSPNITAFKHASLDWYKRLSCMNDTFNKWILCQNKYLHLRKSISNIAKSQLRRAKKILHEADKVWRETICAAHLAKTFMWAAISPGIWEGFQICNALLEQVLCSYDL